MKMEEGNVMSSFSVYDIALHLKGAVKSESGFGLSCFNRGARTRCVG